jgi:uncharacterized protein (DUF58 family)
MSASVLLWVGVLLIAVGLTMSNPVVVVPGMLVLLVVLVARLWTNDSLKKSISCKVSLLQKSARPGDVVDAHFEVKNDQPFPIPWLECSLEWPEELGCDSHTLAAHHQVNRAVLRNIFSLRWFERVTRKFRVRCDTRGEFWFGPVDMTIYDPFGFLEANTEVNTRERLVIYPKSVPVRATGPMTKSPFGEKPKRSWVFDDPSQFRGAREYTQSDPFSRIEWNSTARTGKLHTKLLDASFAAETAIVLDISTGEQPWDGVIRDVFERTILVCASLVRSTYLSGRRFGLFTNGYTRGSNTPAAARTGSGREQYTACMQVLGRIIAVRGFRARAVLAVTAKKVSEYAEIVLVTANLTKSLVQEIERQRVMGRAISVVLTEECALSSRLRVPTYIVGEKGTWSSLEQITLRKARA